MRKDALVLLLAIVGTVCWLMLTPARAGAG